MAQTHLARVERKIVEGEVAEINLVLIKDTTVVHLNEGDDFVTVELKVDPWEVPDRG